MTVNCRRCVREKVSPQACYDGMCWPCYATVRIHNFLELRQVKAADAAVHMREARPFRHALRDP